MYLFVAVAASIAVVTSGQEVMEDNSTSTTKAGSTSPVFENRLLQVVYVVEPPFVNHVDLENSAPEGHYKGPGIIMDILKIMSKKYGLKYNFTLRTDGLWGSKIPNSDQWTGMIGMLQRKEADLIAGAMIIAENRSDVMDFSDPFMTTASGMLIRSPDQFIDNRFLIVTAPFDWKVWAAVAGFIVFSGVMFKIVSQGLRKLDSEEHFSVVDSLWIFYAIFVQQDLARLPTCTATRTMLSVWWLASLSLSGFFTGNMVALFAVSRSTLPFNTRDGMIDKVKNDDYTVVLQNTTTARISFIQNSGMQVFQDLWREMNSRKKWINVSTLDQGIAAVKGQKKLVFIAAKEALDAAASDECSVTTLDGQLIPVWYAIGLQKGSPYKTILNKIISAVGENGFADKWLQDARAMQAFHRGSACKTSLGGGAKGNIDIAGDPLDIERAQGVFWLLLAGVCFAIGGFVLERIYRKLRPHSPPATTPPNLFTARNVQILTIEPAHQELPALEELMESVESYKPRSRRQSVKPFEHTPDAQKGMYNNFRSNVYNTIFVSHFATNKTTHGFEAHEHDGESEVKRRKKSDPNFK